MPRFIILDISRYVIRTSHQQRRHFIAELRIQSYHERSFERVTRLVATGICESHEHEYDELISADEYLIPEWYCYR